MAGFQKDLLVGLCSALGDLVINSQVVLGFTEGFLPVGVVSIAKAHSADKVNGAIVSGSLGMLGSMLQRMVKGPFLSRRRR